VGSRAYSASPVTSARRSICRLGEQVGVALRTKNKVAPVYVSAGHLIDLASAVDLALRSTWGYR
jgi:deoxyribonuclease V